MRDLRRLVGRAAVFVLPFALGGAAAELLLARVPTSYSLKRAGFERMATRAEVLVLGSSHMSNDVDPSRFRVPGFNLANSSQSVGLDAELAGWAMPRAPRLRVLVLELAMFSLERRLYENPERWRNAFYVREFGVYEQPGPGFALDPRSHSLLHAFGGQEALALLLHPARRHGPPITPEGWNPADSAIVPTLDPATGARRVAEHVAHMREAAVPAHLAALRRVIAAAAARGVRVVFVTTPVTGVYAAAMDTARWRRDQGAIRALAAPCGLAYHDFLRDARFGTGDFVDTDHLNARGARRFSVVLDREVIAPALAQGAPRAGCEGGER